MSPVRRTVAVGTGKSTRLEGVQVSGAVVGCALMRSRFFLLPSRVSLVEISLRNMQFSRAGWSKLCSGFSMPVSTLQRPHVERPYACFPSTCFLAPAVKQTTQETRSLAILTATAIIPNRGDTPALKQ